jgi:hypothetical protein
MNLLKSVFNFELKKRRLISRTINIPGETTVKIDNTSGSYYNQLKIKTRR